MIKTHFIEGGKVKWARHYTECLVCHTTDYAHCGRGRCKGCYEKARQKKPSRIKKQREYRNKYIENNPEILDKCKIRWNEWTEEVKDILNCLAKGRRWQKNKIPCIMYKNRPIPLDITSRDPNIQELWKRVKSYIDNRKCGIKI